MRRHKRRFKGHIFSLRPYQLPLIISAAAVLIYWLMTSKIPLPRLPVSFLTQCIREAVLAFDEGPRTELRFSYYDLLADTIPSIRASDEMSKKYAAKYGGIKKIETENEPEQEEPDITAREENLSSGGITFINTPGFPVDAGELLTTPLGFVTQNSDPKVLIVHTHTSEAYAESPASRSEEPEQNVVSVGAEIADTLEENGISVIHDTSRNDSPSYNQSYKKTMALIDKNLTERPTLEIVLDIHRDYIERDDGSLVKPTVTVDGKNAAQIMFVIGTDAMGLEHANWRHNLAFAVQIQNRLNQTAPGLCRAINIRTERFNQHMTKGSMIIEVGTGVNTLEEARYSGRLVGKAIADILKD